MKSWTLSRRTLLRGAGATLALPFLEAMIPSVARAQSAGAPRPRRLVVISVPHGVHMPSWTPSAEGSSYTLPPILQSLAPYKSELFVLSRLANHPASITNQEFAGSHARGSACMLTQTPLKRTTGNDVRNGVSMDQVAANALKAYTRFPSIELGVNSGSATGDCEDGYSCAYLNNISWNTPTTFMPKEVNPRALFDRLFAAGLPSSTPDAAAERRRRHESSILDLVAGQTQQLQARVGRTDRLKLEEYLTSVRELERRLDDVVPPSATTCTPGPAPTDKPGDYEAHVRLMFDLMTLAFQCDLTRVATFMMENPFNRRSFSFLGVSGNHHELSHHGGSASKHAALEKINVWEVQQFAYFLGKLRAVQEADGTLLDNSTIMFTSEFGDGDDHYHRDLPVLLAGRGGGAFKPGRHIRLASQTPLANLYLSMLGAVGVNVGTFGSDGTNPYGTQPLSELA